MIENKIQRSTEHGFNFSDLIPASQQIVEGADYRKPRTHIGFKIKSRIEFLRKILSDFR